MSIWLVSCQRSVIKAPEDLSILPKEPFIRVALEEKATQGRLFFEGQFLLQLEEANYRLDPNIGELKLEFEFRRLTLQGGRRYFEFDAPITLSFLPEFPDQVFYWNNQPYTGELIIYLEADGMQIVNRLPIERYLNGVLTSEMPSGENDYRQALWAQAVAARSYAISRINNPSGDKFDIYSDERDQVYKGEVKSNELVKGAVSGTRGMVVSRNNQPLKVMYHSTCGGVLLNDPNLEELASEPFRTDKSCKDLRLYRWIEIRNADEILNNLNRFYDINSATFFGWKQFGFDLSIQVMERQPGGRVSKMAFQVENQTFIAEGFRIRQVLGKTIEGSQFKVLPSTLFFINQSDENDALFYVIGAGNGHGRGMCQYGAIGRSISQKGYQEILAFYYPNTELTRVY